jgi:hypothetical protein
MIGSELVAELDESSRNLNTSPWTVSNLEGDLYDYHFFAFCDSGSTTNGSLSIRFNGDSGTNYAYDYMRGTSSTAQASVSTGDANIFISQFTRNQSSRNSLAMGSILGSSGDQRLVTDMHCSGHTPQVYKMDGRWTNTADEISSMSFIGSISASYKWHIAVYRTPKESVQGTWEYMAELNWSSESTEKSFTGLDGDTDIQYRLTYEGDQDLLVEYNNDNGSNYVLQYLLNGNGSIAAANITQTSQRLDGKNGEVIINAESGIDRLGTYFGSDTINSQQRKAAYWWQNTADNLTSLECRLASSGTGSCKLYRRINPTVIADVLPFETIKTFDVSGNYSSGDTLSGLTCDDYKLIKIEWIGTGATNILIQFNSDTGSNYTYQRVRGSTSTADATNTTLTFSPLKNGNDASENSYSTFYLYPKSGEYRPSLTKMMYDEDTISFWGNWWLNSANEITSIKTYSGTTDSLSGQIKISVLR